MRHVSVPAAPAVRVAAMEHIMYVAMVHHVVIQARVPLRINVRIIIITMRRQIQRHIMYPAHGLVHTLMQVVLMMFQVKLIQMVYVIKTVQNAGQD